jgi:hypothetical protein
MAGILSAALALIAAGCGEARGSGEARVGVAQARFEEEHPEPAHVLPRTARAHGRSQVEISEDFQRYNYSIPAADHPALNPTADCNAGQSGPIFNAPLFPFSGVLNARTCQVPRGKHVFYTVRGVFNDFPCPEPFPKPAPGQSLEDFLREGAIAGNALFNPASFDLLVDGAPVDIAAHRITTPLFDFVGDLSLSIPGFDVCVTGQSQVGVFDGWQILIAPPSPGQHTVVLRSKASGRSRTLTLVVPADDRED